ncbi:transporter, small conductance mechanosensitive ion channel (MscS) family protein [Tepidicaulis marinus]|uniref:Transporter, small conductance mechanosensitive ion channel (MscS) family protein n=1 Tax=Tepidicaulis marinus TaxID=1333998 RepID=A0A081BAB0_9HYPH|nr:mechanosensitive ion channel domain-containing protein [Tepidicaulis marinus]GAK44978.1 transporter, small conductance mechanosensitive ion channel (MscS) family protein [Tepidicaulis marinus]
MENIDQETLNAFAGKAETWLERLLLWGREEFLSLDMAAALGAVAVAAAVFWAMRKWALPLLYTAAGKIKAGYWVHMRLQRLAELTPALAALLLLGTMNAGLLQAGFSPDVSRIAAQLLTAWIIIKFAVLILKDSAWTPVLAGFVWTVTALAIVGWLDPLMMVMDQVGFSMGEFRLSLLGVVQAALLFAVLMWVAALISRVLENRLGRLAGVTPSARVLVGKIIHILFLAFAVMVALTSVGIDFTAIAVFSGAVGVGIGFGLQKVVSNLISGIILLLDRSIKPGDVIEIGDAYGWIEKLGARHVAIITRDGKEFLIPNEDLITQQVINWSYTDKIVRFKIGVGISYRSDVRKAMDLMLEAADGIDRILKDPPPAVRLVGFGDSSVDLELRIWLKDPESGTVNAMSDARLRIWDLFHENGIEFPFPQRDLHIVSAEGLETIMQRARPSAGEDAGKR